MVSYTILSHVARRVRHEELTPSVTSRLRVTKRRLAVHTRILVPGTRTFPAFPVYYRRSQPVAVGLNVASTSLLCKSSSLLSSNSYNSSHLRHGKTFPSSLLSLFVLFASNGFSGDEEESPRRFWQQSG